MTLREKITEVISEVIQEEPNWSKETYNYYTDRILALLGEEIKHRQFHEIETQIDDDPFGPVTEAELDVARTKLKPIRDVISEPDLVKQARECLQHHGPDKFCEEFDCRSIILAYEFGLRGGGEK